MFHVVLRRSGPEWDPSRPMEEQSDWPAHASFMDGLVDAGFVVLGGPLADGHRVVHAVEADAERAVCPQLHAPGPLLDDLGERLLPRCALLDRDAAPRRVDPVERVGDVLRRRFLSHGAIVARHVPHSALLAA